MSKAVQQGAGQPLRAEDLGPLVEGQVGGDQDRTSLVALAEDLEEELRAGLGEWNEAQLVDPSGPEWASAIGTARLTVAATAYMTKTLASRGFSSLAPRSIPSPTVRLIAR